MIWSTNERRLALFPAGTIARDPHHGKFPTNREGFRLLATLSIQSSIQTDWLVHLS